METPRESLQDESEIFGFSDEDEYLDMNDMAELERRYRDDGYLYIYPALVDDPAADLADIPLDTHVDQLPPPEEEILLIAPPPPTTKTCTK
jgi:hypothetical protein